MKKLILKYKTHVVCLVCGIALGFFISYVVFSISINTNVVDEDTISKSIVEEDNNVSTEDETVTYNKLIEDYKMYLQSVKVGDEITFGNYEQDNNIYNGKESIEWVVLYKSNKNSMMLVSKYILDCMPYDFDDTNVTWKDSDVRKYLNNDFYDMAFGDIYKIYVMENTMTNNPNVNYKTSGGNETNDKVFLLSESQAKKYFSKNEKDGSNFSRASKPTEYAKAKGIASIVDKNVWYDGNCSYYLRTPGVEQSRVEVVEPNGAIYEYGELVKSIEVGIRPCIWVKY